jgi:hypothetical protein
MQLLKLEDGYFLEHEGHRIPIDDSEISVLKLMTPLGRKVFFRNAAKIALATEPDDQRAALLLDWFHLPARDWSFQIQ